MPDGTTADLASLRGSDLTCDDSRRRKRHDSVASREVPLCVDLDGTLVFTDTLWDACLALVREGLSVFLIPLWILRGKAYLKKKVAALSRLDVTTLPYNEVLLEELRRQAKARRAIWLCTGADELIARKIAEHVPVFAGVIASDGQVNLVGSNKRRALEARFGKAGFDYIGNSTQDLPIWREAREAHVVNPSGGLLRSIERAKLEIAAVYKKPLRKATVSLWLRAIRIHQWAKNLLIFVPLALAHHPGAALEALAAFAAFGFVASSGYLINDVLDLQQDRQHRIKKNRPFASGDLPVAGALALVPALWLMAVLLSLLLPSGFGLLLAIYFICSLVYSVRLKQLALVDVMMLAGLYTIRIAAGGAATHIAISQWTLAVSVFLFLSLAMIKRVSELRQLSDVNSTAIPGREYMTVDLQQLCAMGSAAGYLSVLVTALYISSTDVQKLYGKPHVLWFILPIQLYWISRIWLLANRGWIDQDPILFALKDRLTYIAGALALVIAVLAA